MRRQLTGNWFYPNWSFAFRITHFLRLITRIRSCWSVIAKPICFACSKQWMNLRCIFDWPVYGQSSFIQKRLCWRQPKNLASLRNLPLLSFLRIDTLSCNLFSFCFTNMRKLKSVIKIHVSKTPILHTRNWKNFEVRFKFIFRYSYRFSHFSTQNVIGF